MEKSNMAIGEYINIDSTTGTYVPIRIIDEPNKTPSDDGFTYTPINEKKQGSGHELPLQTRPAVFNKIRYNIIKNPKGFIMPTKIRIDLVVYHHGYI